MYLFIYRNYVSVEVEMNLCSIELINKCLFKYNSKLNSTQFPSIFIYLGRSLPGIGTVIKQLASSFYKTSYHRLLRKIL